MVVLSHERSISKFIIGPTKPNSAKLTRRVLKKKILSSRPSWFSLYLSADLTVIRMPPRYSILTGPAPTYQPFPHPPELESVPTPVGLTPDLCEWLLLTLSLT
jgi:hypothetical protein